MISGGEVRGVKEVEPIFQLVDLEAEAKDGNEKISVRYDVKSVVRFDDGGHSYFVSILLINK